MQNVNTANSLESNVIKLNKERVKRAAALSHTATVTMLILGFRQRAHTSTTLASIKNQLTKMKEKINDRDFMDFWKELEAAGAGSLILGRRDKQTRFEWNYSLRRIAQLAIEGKEVDVKKFEERLKQSELEPVVKVVAPKKQIKKESTAIKQPSVVYNIQFKPGYMAQVILPEDISEEELQRLTNCIRQ